MIDQEFFSNSPLYEPLMPAISKFAVGARLPNVDELNANLPIHGIRFVPQESPQHDFSSGYEPRIFLHGEVQTRADNWHDFFNALVWHRFSKTKRVINRLHYELHHLRYPQKLRTPAENMLTLFDENGAIVVARNSELLDLIRHHQWHELFWQRREAWQSDLKVVLFGHGLYEKALHPYIGLTSPSLLFVDEDFSHKNIDDMTARFLIEKNHTLCTRDLSPLPILGLPGVCAENDREEFYANTNYFRPRPAKKAIPVAIF